VFRAVDTRTGSLCGFKRILPEVSEEEDFVRELEDGARIASALEHSSIARVLDFGALEGSSLIAYELVDGVDLRVIFENASLSGERLPLAFSLHTFRRSSRASQRRSPMRTTATSSTATCQSALRGLSSG
jgi:serine/threonine protein kinase